LRGVFLRGVGDPSRLKEAMMVPASVGRQKRREGDGGVVYDPEIVGGWGDLRLTWKEEDAVVGAGQELGADKKDVGEPFAITELSNDN
jgi:hypothetical protein